MRRYEDLRRCQFDNERGWGLSLFMRQGMAAWVRACETDVPVAATESQIPDNTLGQLESKDAVTLEIPGELRFDIAAHIANMIQSCMEVTT